MNNQPSKKLTQLAGILPGLLIWVLLLSPIWAGPLFRLLFNNARFVIDLYGGFIILLAAFWLIKAFLTMAGTIVGYKFYQDSLKVNWLQKVKDLNHQNIPNHIVSYPVSAVNFKELKRTLDGILNQNYPKENIWVVISMEERKRKNNPNHWETIQSQVIAEYGDVWQDRLITTFHPENLPGEVIGAAANRTWAAKTAVAEITKRGLDVKNFIITSPDEDIVFHPNYLAEISYKYLTVLNPEKKFFQTAMYTFNNNYWEVPALIRVLSTSLTIPVLASSITERHLRETFSCYSLSLNTLILANYWDVNLGIDDTTFYWKPFFMFNGEWDCEIIYAPLYADAVYHPNYLLNHTAQYKQYVRWGWGVISVPIAVVGLIKSKNLNIFTRISKLAHLFQVFVLWKVMVYLLTFAVPMFFYLNPQYSELTAWYSLPNTLSSIMGIAVLFIIPTTIYRALISPPKPQEWSQLRYYATFILEAPLSIITILTFSFIPFIEASTRFMLGQSPFKSITWSDKTHTK